MNITTIKYGTQRYETKASKYSKHIETLIIIQFICEIFLSVFHECTTNYSLGDVHGSWIYVVIVVAIEDSIYQSHTNLSQHLYIYNMQWMSQKYGSEIYECQA